MGLTTKKLHPKKGGWKGLVMQTRRIDRRLFATGGLGSGGQILRSDDDGKTWSETQWRRVRAAGPWQSIMSADEQHGLRQVSGDDDDLFAVGEYGTILHSVDGGETWAREEGVGGGCMFGLAKNDAGWFAAGDAGVFKRGRTGKWKNVFKARGLARFYDTPRGTLIVGDDGVLLRLEADGSVEKLRSGTNTHLYGCTSIEERVVLCGAGGTVLVSDGRAFEQRETPVAGRLMEVVRLGDVLVAVGEGGVVITSTNRGDRWQQVESPTKNDFWGAWSDGETAYFSGNDGLIVRATWTDG